MTSTEGTRIVTRKNRSSPSSNSDSNDSASDTTLIPDSTIKKSLISDSVPSVPPPYGFEAPGQAIGSGEGTLKTGGGEVFLPDDAKEGLFNIRAIALLVLWYFFSFCTLFLNKYILSFLHGEPTLLGAIQMLSTTCLGFVQMYIPCGLYTYVDRKGKPKGFFRNMILVGSMRFSTVVMGLIALKYISVSFTETVKSTGPIFTVVVSFLIIGETSGPCVVLSLLPLMGGLALCSAYELSFNIMGFAAALGTNLMDCLQNVFSKLLISGADYRYTPAELQFYTSVASVVVQIPASFVVMDWPHARKDLGSSTMAFAYVMNGVCFHMQSITAYALMSYISPVTHSVANTVKRAILIWLSVLVFGNDVTILSAAGTIMVFIGVLLYSRARDYEHNSAHPTYFQGRYGPISASNGASGILIHSKNQSPPHKEKANRRTSMQHSISGGSVHLV